MPRIPQFTSQTALRGLDTGPLAVAAHRVGIAGQEEGNEVAKIGGQINQLAGRFDQNTSMDYLNKSIDFETAEEQKYQDAKQNADPADPNWLPNYLNDAKQRRADFDSKFSFYTAAGDKYQAESSAAWLKQTSQRASADHAIATADLHQSTMDKAITAIGMDSYDHPENVSANLEKLDAQVKPLLASVAPEHVATEMDKFGNGVVKQAASAMMDRLAANPSQDGIDAARKLFNDPKGPYTAHLTADQHAEVNAKLDVMSQGILSTNAQIAAQTLPDLYERIRNGNGGEDQAAQIIQMGGGKKGPESSVWQAEQDRKLGDSIAYGQAAQWGKTQTDDAIGAHVRDLTEQLKTASADDSGPLQRQIASLTSFAKRRDEAFRSDQVKYVLDNYPSASAAWEAYNAKPSPEAFAAYASQSAGIQTHLYPAVPVKVLPTEMKSDLKSKMMLIGQTPEGAVQAGSILSNLRTTTGGYYNSAVHELEREKIISPSQFAAAQIMGKAEGFALGQEILRAEAIQDGDLRGAPPKMAADKAMAKALAPLAATFADSVNGHELMAGYVEAGSAVMRARGKVDNATASALANTMIADRFNIQNNLRIPKSFDDRDVKQGSDLILKHIDQHDIQAPKSFSGLGEPLQKEAFVRDLKDYGYWNTNERGDGAVLYYQGLPVYETNGKSGQKPVEVPFDDLAKVGKQNRNIGEDIYRFATAPGTLSPFSVGGAPAKPLTDPQDIGQVSQEGR